MPMQISRVPNLPVIIFQYVGSAKAPDDMETTLKEVSAFKKERGGRVYRVIDMTKIQVDFSLMMLGMAAEVGREGGSNDPDVTTIFVASGELLKFGAESLREQKQYGQAAQVHMVDTQEEALNFVRKDMQA